MLNIDRPKLIQDRDRFYFAFPLGEGVIHLYDVTKEINQLMDEANPTPSHEEWL